MHKSTTQIATTIHRHSRLTLAFSATLLISVFTLYHFSFTNSTPPITSAISAPINLTHLPAHLIIPGRIDTSISPSLYQSGHWTQASDQATFITTSATPGETGNTIICGPTTPTIMGNIRSLHGGETITLTLRSGANRLYRVVSTHQVSASDDRFFSPSDTEILTLSTPTGLLHQHRFIAIATPVTPLTPTPSAN